MSWLGDQINTITEKLTDFTKEVLIENRTAELTEEGSKQIDTLSFKELADLCREKDRKIESLMQEKENLEKSIDELDQQHRQPLTIFVEIEIILMNSTLLQMKKYLLPLKVFFSTPKSSEDETDEDSPDTHKPSTKTVNWFRKLVPRPDGSRTDVYYYQEGCTKRLRTLKDIEKYCKDHNLTFDSDIFNFSQSDTFNGVTDGSKGGAMGE
ncbi:thyroid receptor-interacting protein 11 [Trichonephila clavata]|uniref:Thyroid receptor-interacting protein 11 n=1 Tax=Trichonephila clavata TaxID=2740835 RepID=A0A8X6HU61_TRICU|nr:thyroid receptor-interacting protein 11 [Trichonephila clavata]